MFQSYPKKHIDVREAITFNFITSDRWVQYFQENTFLSVVIVSQEIVLSSYAHVKPTIAFLNLSFFIKYVLWFLKYIFQQNMFLVFNL